MLLRPVQETTDKLRRELDEFAATRRKQPTSERVSTARRRYARALSMLRLHKQR